MRRLISILLLAVVGLLWAVPLAAAASSPSESNLPACCRRGGAHHCAAAMQMSADAAAKPAWRAPKMRCPYCPTVPGSLHLQTFAEWSSIVMLRPVAQGGGVAAAQQDGIAQQVRSRANSQRGPPSFFLN